MGALSKRPKSKPALSRAKNATKLGLLSGAALGMTAGEVMATIMDFGSIPSVAGWGTLGSTDILFDVDSDGIDDLLLHGDAAMMAGGVDLRHPGMMLTLNVLTDGAGFVAALPAGATIGAQPSSSWAQPAGTGAPFLDVMYDMMNMTYSTLGNFNLSSPQYFGFQFVYGSTLVNAWGLLNITGGGGNEPLQFELTSGAFETSGATIEAGAMALPEPSTGGLMALGLGAAGVVSMRRRRQEREAAEATLPAASAS